MSIDCNALWIGSALTRSGAACLGSFVEVGHKVNLYSYKKLEAPKGVTVLDAGTIMPEDQIIRHQGSLVGPFTDIFRYELLHRGAGVWIDTDLICLRPLPQLDYLLGWESETHINGAVLSLPSGSEILNDLRKVALTRTEPEWLPWTDKVKWWLRHRFTNLDIRTRKWGVIGPQAITFLVAKHGLTDRVLPQDAFYSLPIPAVPRLAKERDVLRQYITPQSYCVHLWGKHLDRLTAQRGSFLDHLEKGDWRMLV